MRKVVKASEFEKLLEEYTPKEIIYMYTMWKIDLTKDQLQQLIDLKNCKSEKEKEILQTRYEKIQELKELNKELIRLSNKNKQHRRYEIIQELKELNKELLKIRDTKEWQKKK